MISLVNYHDLGDPVLALFHVRIIQDGRSTGLALLTRMMADPSHMIIRPT